MEGRLINNTNTIRMMGFALDESENAHRCCP